MRVEMPDQRGQSISVIGALSLKHGLNLLHVFAGSNNVDTVAPFISELKGRCADSKTIVVMDNLPVHHSKRLHEYFDDERFSAQFLPPQSCELNPIEKVWSLLKGEYRKTAHEILADTKSTEKMIEAAIEKIKMFASGFKQEDMRRMARANYSNMARTL
jgi:transposase